jgi:hypothetical protein
VVVVPVCVGDGLGDGEVVVPAGALDVVSVGVLEDDVSVGVDDVSVGVLEDEVSVGALDVSLGVLDVVSLGADEVVSVGALDVVSVGVLEDVSVGVLDEDVVSLGADDVVPVGCVVWLGSVVPVGAVVGVDVGVVVLPPACVWAGFERRYFASTESVSSFGACVSVEFDCATRT